MNITIDNYEAYLLDYMEGNLSPEGAAELRQFVAAQGLDWDELTEELPQLEAPQIAYDGKDRLKKKGKVIPMLVKVGAAAAAAGLLFALVWKPVEQRPQQELMAELKPIEVSHIDAKETTIVLPRRATESIDWLRRMQSISMPRTRLRRDGVLSGAADKPQTLPEREAAPLLAEIQSLEAPAAISSQAFVAQSMGPDFVPDHLSRDYDLAAITDDGYGYDEPSLLSKGLLKMTDGKYESLGDMIQGGFQLAKEEINLAATDIAVTAYYRMDDRIEEARERWEKRREP